MMITAQLALRQIVNGPLHLRQRWGAVVGRFDLKGWAPTLLSGVLFVIGCVYWAGGFTSSQSKDVQVLQTQYREMSLQLDALRSQVAPLAQVPALIQRLNDRLDAAPRADMLETRLSEIQRHLSALDGRADADETRLRSYEDRVIRDDTRLDVIEKGSNTPLGNRR